MVRLTATIPLYGLYIANRFDTIQKGMVVFKRHFYFRVQDVFVNESNQYIKLDLELITDMKEIIELDQVDELPHPLTVLSIMEVVK